MRRVLGFAIAAMVALGAPPALAVFPGQNGRIALQRTVDGVAHIYTMNPDGSGMQMVTSGSASDANAAWSPDGKKLAFVRRLGVSNFDIYVVNADGTGLTQLTSLPTSESDPSWSPDGARIAFASNRDGPDSDIFTMSSDGSDLVNLTDDYPDQDIEPAWSPDGSTIAFVRHFPEDFDFGTPEHDLLYEMDPDGTTAQQLHPYPAGDCGVLLSHLDPNWSPDANALVFSEVWQYNSDGEYCNRISRTAPGVGDYRVLAQAAPLDGVSSVFDRPFWSPDGTRIGIDYSGVRFIDPDGSNPVDVPVQSGSTTLDPDWQPLPAAGYPHPKGAGPVHMSLVPAYLPCTSPNRTHGPPLAFGSCNPPMRSSTYLTVGTADANGAAAKSASYVRFDVQAGDPATPADEADVALNLSASDVRLASDLSDYTGTLQAMPTLRVTDKDNTPDPGGPGPGTVTDFTLTFPAPCAPTADATVGSTCTAATSADALAPGAVKEKRRAIWQLERFDVGDGGPQATPANRPFLVPGLFVP